MMNDILLEIQHTVTLFEQLTFRLTEATLFIFTINTEKDIVDFGLILLVLVFRSMLERLIVCCHSKDAKAEEKFSCCIQTSRFGLLLYFISYLSITVWSLFFYVHCTDLTFEMVGLLKDWPLCEFFICVWILDLTFKHMCCELDRIQC